MILQRYSTRYILKITRVTSRVSYIRGTWYHPWVVPEDERGSTRRKDTIRHDINNIRIKVILERHRQENIEYK